MENLEMINSLEETYKGKRVLITGHTGFKGGWLSLWLQLMGAKVFGYSLEAVHDSVYHSFKLKEKLENEQIDDIRNYEKVRNFIVSVQPEIIFHMAAQPLVLDSFTDPITTYDTNVMGTVNLLESCKKLKKQCTVIIVTTDKVYKNKEWEYSYRESDELGGKDPYSASKSCCELVVNSYISSFFNNGAKWNNIKVCTVRAGNVIGGGDWSANRVLPDCIRSISEQKEIVIRNPNAVRPWQHVLEPLYGYLIAAMKIYNSVLKDDYYLENSYSYNFGPSQKDNKRVKDLVEEVLKNWDGKYVISTNKQVNLEAERLTLAIDKSINELKWMPVLSFEETVAKTVEWYKASFDLNVDIEDFTIGQILSFCSKLRSLSA
ncbi:MAG: CDP-glucose 4,6-dehydratase [Parvicella sp.]|jgi:CDP-glucose 4,6-dehydratase